MGEVVEVGSAVHNLRPGDRVVVPFAIACGQCFFCQRSCGRFATTQTQTPAWRKSLWLLWVWAFWLFPYVWGYAGGQAEYIRVPFADVGPSKYQPVPRRAGPVFVRYLSHRLYGC